MTNQEKALALTKIGMHVFPCREKPYTFVNNEGKDVTLDVKTPYTKNGFLDASSKPEDVEKWWSEHPNALVGVATGASGLCVLDIDQKIDDQGEIIVDGYVSLEEEWLDFPETFTYGSIGGLGEHHVYAAPQDKTLTGLSKYRKMKGVDRRAGGSYVVWAGDIPKSRSVFTEPPEWFLDETTVRSLAAFEGTVKDWYDKLVPGTPNLLVRNALSRITEDMSHSEMVAAQHEAIRLGAEGNPGVPELLSALEEAWLNRPTENHGTPETEWAHKFTEALASGIEKHGGAIDLLAGLPEFSVANVPSEVPDRLVTAAPGDNTVFSQLLAALIKATTDDMLVLTTLWNATTTRDLAREWGLEFCFGRIQKARRIEEPVGENPGLDRRQVETAYTSFLSPEEQGIVADHPTFIDIYLEASAKKGWTNPVYAIPSAWTILSMGLGFKAWTPTESGRLGLNLWFVNLGPSGTGKSVEHSFAMSCLDLLLEGDVETPYNIGADSSPEGMHEALLGRDMLSSGIIHDEAADFFDNLQGKEWMSGIMDKMSKWYDGYNPASNKVRLKDLKGKSSLTSFNILLSSTSSKLLPYVTRTMFESGFLARVNWSWDDSNTGVDDLNRYDYRPPSKGKQGVRPEAYDLVSDIFMARNCIGDDPVSLGFDDEAISRLNETTKKMVAQMKDRLEDVADFDSFGKPSVTRMQETMVKCAGLLALWRGETQVRLVDVLTAIHYAERWYNDLYKVIDQAGTNDFNRDADLIESFVGAHEKGVSKAQIFDKFKKMVSKGTRELEERVDFLVISGRIRTVEVSKKVKYIINGGSEA